MPIPLKWILLFSVSNVFFVCGEYLLATKDKIPKELEKIIHSTDAKWWVSLSSHVPDPISLCIVYDELMTAKIAFYIPADKHVTNGQINLRYAVYNGWEMHPLTVITDGQYTRFYHSSTIPFSTSTTSSHYFSITQTGIIEHYNSDSSTGARLFGRFLLNQALVDDNNTRDCLPIEISWDGFPDMCSFSVDKPFLAVPVAVSNKEVKEEFKIFLFLAIAFLVAGGIITVTLIVMFLVLKRKKPPVETTGVTTNTK